MAQTWTLVQSAASANTNTTTERTSATATLTNNPTSGNLLVFCFSWSGTLSSAPTGVSGFTSAVSDTDPSFGKAEIRYKISDGSEGKTYTVTTTTAQRMNCAIMEYSGHTGSSPLDVVGKFGGQTQSGFGTVPIQKYAYKDSLIVGVYTTGSNSGIASTGRGSGEAYNDNFVTLFNRSDGSDSSSDLMVAQYTLHRLPDGSNYQDTPYHYYDGAGQSTGYHGTAISAVFIPNTQVATGGYYTTATDNSGGTHSTYVRQVASGATSGTFPVATVAGSLLIGIVVCNNNGAVDTTKISLNNSFVRDTPFRGNGGFPWIAYYSLPNASSLTTVTLTCTNTSHVGSSNLHFCHFLEIANASSEAAYVTSDYLHDGYWQINRGSFPAAGDNRYSFPRIDPGHGDGYVFISRTYALGSAQVMPEDYVLGQSGATVTSWPDPKAQHVGQSNTGSSGSARGFQTLMVPVRNRKDLWLNYYYTDTSVGYEDSGACYASYKVRAGSGGAGDAWTWTG